MINEAIVLAGGLGTRLRSVVNDVPKCLAIVDGRPFLFYIIQFLKRNGVTRFIFSLGYKSELIISFLEKELDNTEYEFVIEQEPLGTGGATQLALHVGNQPNVIVVNGDTYFNVDLTALSHFHLAQEAECSLSLKPMKNFNRYGVVELDENHIVSSFKEKQFFETGLINGGIYALNKKAFLRHHLPEKFSFEKDYLEAFIPGKKIKGFIQDGYFIDIGIPVDYKRAQTELKQYTQAG